MTRDSFPEDRIGTRVRGDLLDDSPTLKEWVREEEGDGFLYSNSVCSPCRDMGVVTLAVTTKLLTSADTDEDGTTSHEVIEDIEIDAYVDGHGRPSYVDLDEEEIAMAEELIDDLLIALAAVEE